MGHSIKEEQLSVCCMVRWLDVCISWLFSRRWCQVGGRIKNSVQDLGKACIDLVQDAGNVQTDPTDSFAKRDLADHARLVSEKVRWSRDSSSSSTVVSTPSNAREIPREIDVMMYHIFDNNFKLNPFHAVATIVHERKMQKVLKTIQTLSC